MQTIFRSLFSKSSVSDVAVDDSLDDVFVRDLTTSKLQSRFKMLHRKLWGVSSEIDVAHVKGLIDDVRVELERRVVIQPSESFEDYVVRAGRAGRRLLPSRGLSESPLLEFSDDVSELRVAYLRLYDLLWNAGRFSSQRFVHTPTSMFYEAYQVRQQLVEVHKKLVSLGVEMPSYYGEVSYEQ